MNFSEQAWGISGERQHWCGPLDRVVRRQLFEAAQPEAVILPASSLLLAGGAA